MRPLYVIIYSKYCDASMYLKNRVSSTLDNKLDMYYLCIDNNSVRNYVLNDKDMSLAYVPTVLVKVLDTVEKYEGQRGIEYIDRLIDQHAPPPPPPPRVDEVDEVDEVEGVPNTPSSSLKFHSTASKANTSPEVEEQFDRSTRIEDLNISSSSKPNKPNTGDIMAAALSMQKERESTVKNT